MNRRFSVIKDKSNIINTQLKRKKFIVIKEQLGNTLLNRKRIISYKIKEVPLIQNKSSFPNISSLFKIEKSKINESTDLKVKNQSNDNHQTPNNRPFYTIKKEMLNQRIRKRKTTMQSFEEIIDLSAMNKKHFITNSDIILALFEICINFSSYNLGLKIVNINNKSFWDALRTFPHFQRILQDYKIETLRKYWLILSEYKDKMELITTIKKHAYNIDNNNLKLKTIICSVIEGITKGENIPKYLKYITIKKLHKLSDEKTKIENKPIHLELGMEEIDDLFLEEDFNFIDDSKIKKEPEENLLNKLKIVKPSKLVSHITPNDNKSIIKVVKIDKIKKITNEQKYTLDKINKIIDNIKNEAIQIVIKESQDLISKDFNEISLSKLNRIISNYEIGILLDKFSFNNQLTVEFLCALLNKRNDILEHLEKKMFSDYEDFLIINKKSNLIKKEKEEIDKRISYLTLNK